MPKLEDLDINETSGVDFPAHLAEGWLMLKARELLKAATVTCQVCGADAPKSDSYCPDCGERMEPMNKREFTGERREELASKDQAMPDGSYPIVNRKDLANAIQSFGRAKDPAAVKAHIIRRARALGATDLLPEDWTATKATLRALYRALGEVLTPGAEGGDMSNVPEEVAAFLDEANAPPTVRKAIEDAYVVPEPSEPEDVMKSVPEPVREMFEKERLAREELEKALETERERRETEEAITKARSWSHIGLDPTEFGPVLRVLRANSPEAAEAVEKVLDGAEKVAETSELFRSMGKSTPTVTGAEERLEAMAREAMSKSGTDYATAYSDILGTPDGEALYAEAQRQKEGR